VRQLPNRDSSIPFVSIGALLRSVTIRFRVPSSEREDCVQEAWLALLEKHPDWPLEEPRTLAWLVAVTRNQAINFHRRIQRQRSRRIADLAFLAIDERFPRKDPEIDPVSPTEAHSSGIQTLLNGFADVDRAILVLRTRDLSFKEIGLILNLQPAQARARYHRALQKARRANDEPPHANVRGRAHGR
jgi:RNA polymerase sigma factor (sigma-70 family)